MVVSPVSNRTHSGISGYHLNYIVHDECGYMKGIFGFQPDTNHSVMENRKGRFPTGHIQAFRVTIRIISFTMSVGI